MIYEADGTITFESKSDMAICLANGLKVTTPMGTIIQFDRMRTNPFRHGKVPLLADWERLSGWIEYDEYKDFKIDNKVIVRYNELYYKRHFAGVIKGKPHCYADGMSSFSSGSIDGYNNLSEPELIGVEFCVKATPENIDKYITERA